MQIAQKKKSVYKDDEINKSNCFVNNKILIIKISETTWCHLKQLLAIIKKEFSLCVSLVKVFIVSSRESLLER